MSVRSLLIWSLAGVFITAAVACTRPYSPYSKRARHSHSSGLSTDSMSTDSLSTDLGSLSTDLEGGDSAATDLR